MAGFAKNFEFFVQEYDTWVSYQPRQDARVAFVILVSRGTDLGSPQSFLEEISRTKKPPQKLKIMEMVPHTMLFLRRSRHLEYSDYVTFYTEHQIWF